MTWYFQKVQYFVVHTKDLFQPIFKFGLLSQIKQKRADMISAFVDFIVYFYITSTT